MKLAYACAFIYRLDKYQQSRDSMYSRIYLDYVQDIKKCFSFHLVIMIAKKKQKINKAVVFACVDCLKKIVDRIYMLPEYVEKIDYVCNRFYVCYSCIWSLFEGVDELNKAPFRRSLIQYTTLAGTGMTFVTVVYPVS